MIALVDCNNFYASCERLFNPRLAKRPIVVLSCNDGCIIARSNEAKALGIPMGAPYFEYAKLMKDYDVHVCSSNFTLYGDISDRVMTILRMACPYIEIYSVDEAFLDLSEVPAEQQFDFCKNLREKILKWTGIPVSVGVGQTKTLAKLANDRAKSLSRKDPAASGVEIFPANTDSEALFRKIPVEDIWGIGRQSAKKLKRHGIHSVWDFRSTDDVWIKKNLSVVGLRTAWELRGISCISLSEEEPPPKKSIMSSRAFGRPISNLFELSEAVASYTARAAEKLRDQRGLASYITVYLMLHPFNPNVPQTFQADIVLPEPTSYTPTLIQYAKLAMEQMYREGVNYRKAGVLLSGLVSERAFQRDLFAPRHRKIDKEERVMDMMDKLNAKFGRKVIRLAAEGMDKPWGMKQTRKSDYYTTQWENILTIDIPK